MVAMSVLRRLEVAWTSAREAGVLGPQSAVAFNDHASGFVISDWRIPASVGGAASPYHFVDIGTGAGVPGILLAMQLPSSHWTLLDANSRRCELAYKAVQAVGIGDRVTVKHARAGQLARSPATREYFDGAVARLFGSAGELAECGLPLIKVGAVMVISVSEITERQWRQVDLLALTGCEVVSSWRTLHGIFMAIRRVSVVPERLPRRTAARQRSPLF